MTRPLTLADLMADPGELDVSCLDCHHSATMPVATLLSRYPAKTSFPEVCGAGSAVRLVDLRRVDVRPNWAARQTAGQITSPISRQPVILAVS
jgi:hypothetical protein